MGWDWATAQHILWVFADGAQRGTAAAAEFLESENPVAHLTKDTLTAIAIAAFSSSVINRMIKRREDKRRNAVEGSMRKFVLEAISAAHGGIRDAIAVFDMPDGKHLGTRIRKLRDQLSIVRTLLNSSVAANLSYFGDEQRKAIIDYMAAISWVGVNSAADGRVWLDEIHKLHGVVVKEFHGDSRLLPWNTQEIMVTKDQLRRLDGKPAQRTVQPKAAAPQSEGFLNDGPEIAAYSPVAP